MRILDGKTEVVPIDALKPHPRNPREGDIGAINASIDNNGFYGRVLAQKSTGFILAGNHRWQAMTQAGATEIPVEWIDVDDDHALRILLADNRTNDLASYNDNELADLLEQLRVDTGTLAGTGYDGDDLDQLLDDLGRPATGDWEDAFDRLPDGDREPFQQMTFTLHDEQVEIVKRAIEQAQQAGCDSDLNENRNGNALAALAEAYLA